MIILIYLLKFSACLAIFVVFYKLFLERERMHQLKRFYLLGAIFISLSFPLITFTTYVEPIVVSNITSFESFPEMSVEQESVEAPATNYLTMILWSIYGLGILLFGIKFILNLSKIVYKIKRNPKHVAQDYTHVLLGDLVTPHTFFSYIFLNKQKFEKQQIPFEVFVHEEAHAKQKHSIDVLLIEILQLVFWFNPLIYLTKQFIKMNHEFLADEAVIKQGVEPSNYQQLLLTFSSNVTEPQLANAINYSSIKKRFTVMKTHTSKQKIWTRSFLLLPLVALTLYGFSQKKIIEKPKVQSVISSIQNTKKEKSKVQGDTLKDNYYKNVTVQFRDENNTVILSKKYSELTDVEKKSLPNPITVPLKKSPNLKELDTWKDSKMYGVWLDEKRINNVKLNDFSPDDFSLFYVSNLEKNAINYGKHYYQVSLYTNENYQKRYQNGVPPLGDSVIITINKNDSQQKATPEEVAEYNKMAKHFNSQNPNNTIVKQKDFDRMEFLFNKMSKEQKANAEPFPNFPPPPSPETGFIEANGETLFYVKFIPTRYYNRKGYLVDKTGKTLNGNNQVNASDVLPGQYITKVYKDDKVVVQFKDNGSENIPPPPPPPATKSPLDHVIEMAKKGAKFYNEGKLISSDEAILLLKKNKELNISILKIDTDEPKVYISKEIEVPIDTRITPFKDKHKSVETTITSLVINTDNLDELKNYNWNRLKARLSENDPDKIVSIEIKFNKPVLFDGSKIDSFSHKISCKVSELDDYISKSQRIINKLEPIK